MRKDKNTYIIAQSKIWDQNFIANLRARTQSEFHVIQDKNDLNIATIQKISPKRIFFPHWSYIIPSAIYENFECIIFHMTDLPYGRGGSPLQNLIVNGHEETKISAIQCVKEIDAGPIYLKKPLSLSGSAREIFKRASHIVEDMIIEIIEKNTTPVEQSGQVVTFSRRTPKESDIAGLLSLEKVHDYIRMLDADTYPHAYLETENLRLEFTNSSLQDKCVEATVKITIKESQNE